MPYADVSDLPDDVKAWLPGPAQIVYLQAYNEAWDEALDPASRRPGESREVAADRVARTAVKRIFGGTLDNVSAHDEEDEAAASAPGTDGGRAAAVRDPGGQKLY